MSSDDEREEWADEVDIDELIEDDHEYQFNTQVDEELAIYMQDEMMDDVEGDEGTRASAEEKAVTDGGVRCADQRDAKRQKCPGRKRRIVTVTQWDASARRQMVRQLGQRGVT